MIENKLEVNFVEFLGSNRSLEDKHFLMGTSETPSEL
jgi:hypothetical protein